MTAFGESWGRFPNYRQSLHRATWREDAAPLLAKLSSSFHTTLAFGNGRSYGDSCLANSDHVLHTRALDRFIDVDWATGTITAEAGVTLEEILALAIPKGWFLPVSPGTKYVTLGGALANDVHGKNHHVRGTFGRHVTEFGILRSDSGPLTCSQGENAELFAATVGGLGLTGIILWLRLRLIPIQSASLTTLTERFHGLDEFFGLSDELDTLHEYSVAWIDCLATGARLGRGVFMAGDHTEDPRQAHPVKRKITVSHIPPVSLVNQLTLRLMNSCYYSLHSDKRVIGLTHYEPFFYPLDRILHWNRLYGRAGFQQYQCVIPARNAEPAIREILGAIAGTRSGSFLAVLKKCGALPSPGLMSFPMPGVSLALDFPQVKSLPVLFGRLDQIVREASGRLYPAKDAHMSGVDFRNAYPDWVKVEALRDPRLLSRFWTRVKN